MTIRKKDNNNNKSNCETSCVVCFGTLGVPSRMDIYRFLKEKGKTTVTDVVDHIKLTQPTISYHLKEMKKAGILYSEKLGKEVFYFINDACPVYGHSCVLKDVKFPENVATI